ncbi:MAG TPA: DNA-3-methyladenine glycosylase [Solirubrobacteraceae bacterium]|jgi:DNA-3-methyladenine glycosylase|nr:DNA-3-methyladenine glycosylase [Solirubrobacteraceae bacterium]
MKSTGAEASPASSAQVRSQQRLGHSFYERPVVQVARELIGCTVAHGDTAGVIVETEAYHDSEPASHAFVGLTARTSTLFGPPGNAYVYRSYGIHALLNAVCEPEGVGAAVLIRALRPISGLLEMRKRRGVGSDLELCSGPGKLTQALDVELHQNGSSLLDGPIAIFAAAGVESIEVLSGPRVGITKAVDLPWRFCLAGSPYVSRPRLS